MVTEDHVFPWHQAQSAPCFPAAGETFFPGPGLLFLEETPALLPLSAAPVLTSQ